MWEKSGVLRCLRCVRRIELELGFFVHLEVRYRSFVSCSPCWHKKITPYFLSILLPSLGVVFCQKSSSNFIHSFLLWRRRIWAWYSNQSFQWCYCFQFLQQTDASTMSETCHILLPSPPSSLPYSKIFFILYRTLLHTLWYSRLLWSEWMFFMLKKKTTPRSSEINAECLHNSYFEWVSEWVLNKPPSSPSQLCTIPIEYPQCV